jgi:hypothetical protein
VIDSGAGRGKLSGAARKLDVLQLFQAQPLAVDRHPEVAQVDGVLGASDLGANHLVSFVLRRAVRQVQMCVSRLVRGTAAPVPPLLLILCLHWVPSGAAGARALIVKCSLVARTPL